MAPTKPSGKRYEQYCAVARTLDVVGERWTLLIVRDLLMGPKRYTDLRQGLPGIATDILTTRLRTLEAAGFVRRRELPRPAPATVYELTDAGQRRLAPALLVLGRVSMATLGSPKPGEDVRAERLVVGLRVSFRPDAFADLTETYELTIDGETFTVGVAGGGVETRIGAASDPVMSLTTDTRTFAALLIRETSADDALADKGARLEGERAALDRFIEAFAYPGQSPELADMDQSPTSA
jgi:DNA-binding HxlR family transcriptional regulator